MARPPQWKIRSVVIPPTTYKGLWGLSGGGPEVGNGVENLLSGLFLPQGSKEVPSDTKLSLTKMILKHLFAKITNLTRNSLKESFIPGD